MLKLFISFLSLAVCKAALLEKVPTKDWNYTLERFEWNCTNPAAIATNMRAVRVSPGIYGLNGTVTIGVPIDNRYKVQMKIYRSASGDSQYKRTPFQIPATPMIVFINTVYKKFAIKELKRCSDFPVFEDHFDGPVEAGEYHSNSCILSNEDMPTLVQLGFYKLIFEVEGPEAHLVTVLTAQVFKIA